MIETDCIPSRNRQGHRWDYIGVIRHLNEPSLIRSENPEYAVWICPYCEQKKEVLTGRES